MEIINQENNAKTYSDYAKYEKNITRFAWLVFFCLIFEDVIVRIYILRQPFALNIAILQGVLFFICILLSIIKTSLVKEPDAYQERKSLYLVKSIEIIITVCLISTMYHSAFFYFVALLPIAFIGGVSNGQLPI